MKKLILIFISAVFMTSLHASDLKVEPVYGFERTQREFPAPARYRTSAFLGARVLYGKPAFSIEFELNQGVSNEEFPSDDLEVKYTDRKALLGFRTYPLTSKILGLFLRFGIRAQKNTREIKENGETRKEEDPLSIDPYAGTGLTLVLGNNFSLNTGATLVYNKNAAESSEQFDTRYTFSFTIKAGSR